MPSPSPRAQESLGGALPAWTTWGVVRSGEGTSGWRPPGAHPGPLGGSDPPLGRRPPNPAAGGPTLSGASESGLWSGNFLSFQVLKKVLFLPGGRCSEGRPAATAARAPIQPLLLGGVRDRPREVRGGRKNRAWEGRWGRGGEGVRGGWDERWGAAPRSQATGPCSPSVALHPRHEPEALPVAAVPSHRAPRGPPRRGPQGGRGPRPPSRTPPRPPGRPPVQSQPHLGAPPRAQPPQPPSLPGALMLRWPIGAPPPRRTPASSRHPGPWSAPPGRSEGRRPSGAAGPVGVMLHPGRSPEAGGVERKKEILYNES